VGGLARLKDGKFTIYDPGGHFSKHFISAISEDDESLIVTTSETVALRFKDGQVLPFTIHGQFQRWETTRLRYTATSQGTSGLAT
jgi:hypothetical protein